MASVLPFIPSETNYTFQTFLNGDAYEITVWWNSRDAAWYFSLTDQVGNVIAPSLKIALGTKIGRKVQDDFFRNNVLYAVDTAGTGVDAGFDDLGNRVLVVHRTMTELKEPLTAGT